MDSDQLNSKSKTQSKTQIDLGDDLLEKTAKSSVSRFSKSNSQDQYRSDRITDLNDALKSAEILLSEGLREDAKRVLRSSLRKDPHFFPAQEALEKIQESELKELLSFQGGHSEALENPLKGNSLLDIPEDLDIVLKDLDRDLDLNLKQDACFSVFKDQVGLQSYAKKLEEDLKDLDDRERIDVGIAFLSMELSQLAIPHFQAALRIAEARFDRAQSLNARCLLAEAYLENQKPYDAIFWLDPLITDQELSPKDKIHAFYLLGLSYLDAGKKEISQVWLQQVFEFDPQYRDISLRMKGMIRV